MSAHSFEEGRARAH